MAKIKYLSDIFNAHNPYLKRAIEFSLANNISCPFSFHLQANMMGTISLPETDDDKEKLKTGLEAWEKSLTTKIQTELKNTSDERRRKELQEMANSCNETLEALILQI